MKVIKVLARWMIYALIGLVVVAGIGVVMLNVYKKEILAKINAKLDETLEGDVKIGDYEISFLHAFPHLSITLNDIYLHGPKFESYHKPFLTAKRIHINIVTHQLLVKQVNISSVDVEDGEIFVFKTRAGYTNTEIFKTRRNPGNNQNSDLAIFDLHQINLNNIRFTFHDSLKLKHLGLDLHRTQNYVRYENKTTQLEMRGNMTFHGLMLNAEKGSFLREVNALADLNLELDSTFSELSVHPSWLVFDKAKLALSGNFHLRDNKEFNLSIASDNVDHAEALQIVHDTLASKIRRFDIKGPIKIKIDIVGVMQAGIKPAVDAVFSLQNSQVTFAKLNATKVDLQGSFMNHVNTDVPNDDKNGRLRFEKFKALVDHIPVEATVTLTNMKDPQLDLKAAFDTPLKNLNEN